jgi:uncharacterized protein (TIGR03435 family)
MVTAPSAPAQAPQAEPQPASTAKFATATLKPCTPTLAARKKGAGGKIRWSPGSLNVDCRTLDYLVREAYLLYADGKPWHTASAADGTGASAVPPVSDRLFWQPIDGSPDWFATDGYTIDAKSAGLEGPEMMRGPMMQALLEDRFKLKIRRESREVPVYELTAAKGRLKVPAAREGNCIMDAASTGWEPGQPDPPRLCGMLLRDSNGGADVPGTTIGNFCRQLSDIADRDVIDKTGISGVFDFHFEASSAEPSIHGMPGLGDSAMSRPRGAAETAALFSLVRDSLPKLGLKLVRAKGTGEFLVIDHVEKPPLK